MSDRPAVHWLTTVLDSPDPRRLAAFWERLLGYQRGTDEPEWVTLYPPGGDRGMAVQLEEAYRRPVWPAGPGDQQMSMHLDLQVEDLEAAVAFALECGAEQAAFQPQEHVRVMLDPDGHPFCLFVD